MRWKRAIGIAGVLGASFCGACLAKTVNKTGLASSEARVPGSHSSSVLEGLTLKQVHVYFRHGARTPIHVIPGLEEMTYCKDMMVRTPPHLTFNYQVRILPDLRLPEKVSQYEQHYKKTTLKGGSYAGNLTTYGQEQMYNLGLRLRDAYINRQHLLSGYRQEDVYVRSTNIDRTIASARCVMVGLFGKEDLDRNGPITIPVSTTQDEVLFPNSHMCEVIKKANHASMIHFDNIPGIKEDRQFIEKLLGYKSEKHLNFVFLRDDLIARKTHGYRIPAFIEPHMDMIERNATKMAYYGICGQHDVERPVITQLSAGPAIHLMMQAVDKLVKGDKAPKVYLYSGHDTTLMCLLEAFGIFEWQWPPFGSDLRLEVYQDQAGEYWTRTLYLGEEKIVRGCKKPVCRLSELKNSLKPYTIPRGPQFDDICASKILEKIATSLVQHDKDEVETPEMKEASEIPAGM